MLYNRVITAEHLRKPLNLSAREYIDDKYAYYAYLRNHDPVHRGRLIPLLGAFLLSRHEDCTRLLKDPRFVRNRSTATGGGRFPFPVPKSVSALVHSMISEDEPAHRRLRNLVHKAFTPRMLTKLEGRIEQITGELLDAIIPKRRVDLKREFAYPIPLTMIAEIVGLEPDEVPVLSNYIEAMTGSLSPIAMLRTIGWDLPRASRFVRELIDRKRSRPADDILTGLIEAEQEGDRLSEDELVAMVFLIIVAGYETTYNLITNAVYTLLRHPEQLARLRERPELLDSAIEEVLRYNGPLHATKPEYATEDVTYRGVTIPRGSRVLPLLGSANHDPDVFDEPDVFDIGRAPNRHLGFGIGIHYCLGAPLARMETKIALRALLERSPDLRLAIAPEQMKVMARPGWHQYERLPVELS